RRTDLADLLVRGRVVRPQPGPRRPARIAMIARRGYSAAQVRAAERPLLEAGEPLMRLAAAALAAEVRGFAPQRVLVLVGAGDNGGDALHASAELAADGADVRSEERRVGKECGW